MDIFSLAQHGKAKDISKQLEKKYMENMSEDLAKVVICQNCGKHNSYSYKSLFEKAKVGRKIIKKCEKCNESIIIRKE